MAEKNISVFAIILIGIFLGLIACNRCDHIACDPVPPGFRFSLIDSLSGDNLIENGKLKLNEINFICSNGDTLYFDRQFDDILQVIVCHHPPLKLRVKDKIQIPISYQLQERRVNCCTFTKAETIQFEWAVTQAENGDFIIPVILE